MAERIMVLGPTSTGKSTSLRNCDPKTTFINQVTAKGLPFKGWRKNYSYWNATTNPEGNLIVRDTADDICTVMRYVDSKMPHIKLLVIDDGQFIMSKELFANATVKGYDKFTTMAAHAQNVLVAPDQLRDDLTVAFLWHTDIEDDVMCAKTCGKMLKQNMQPETLFTYVIMTKILREKEGAYKHVFVVKSDGTNTVKTPMGMYEEMYIDNDLNAVLETIKKYNEGE